MKAHPEARRKCWRCLTTRDRAATAGLLQALKDTVHIMLRALAAAHHYETLRIASDQTLAELGLTRNDVPRAAYRMLTGGW